MRAQSVMRECIKRERERERERETKSGEKRKRVIIRFLRLFLEEDSLSNWTKKTPLPYR